MPKDFMIFTIITIIFLVCFWFILVEKKVIKKRKNSPKRSYRLFFLNSLKFNKFQTKNRYL